MTEFDLPPESAPPGPLIRLVRDQRVAFLMVGAINTVVGFAIFIACSQSVGHLVEHRFGKVGAALVTVGIAHVLGVLFAFMMYRRFVFRVRGHVLRDLVRFWSVYLTAGASTSSPCPCWSSWACTASRRRQSSWRPPRC